jgi:hypothetical protein
MQAAVINHKNQITLQSMQNLPTVQNRNHKKKPIDKKYSVYDKFVSVQIH